MLTEVINKISQFTEADPQWLDDIPCRLEFVARESDKRWIVHRPSDPNAGRVIVKADTDCLEAIFYGELNPQVAFLQRALEFEGELQDVLWVNVFFARACKVIAL